MRGSYRYRGHKHSTKTLLALRASILAAHNEIEEGAGGLYETCDDLLVAEADEIVARLPREGNHNEGTMLSKESMDAMKYWKAMLYRLIKIDESLGSMVENQKRLLELFAPQRAKANRKSFGSWIQKKLGL